MFKAITESRLYQYGLDTTTAWPLRDGKFSHLRSSIYATPALYNITILTSALQHHNSYQLSAISIAEFEDNGEIDSFTP